MPIPVTSRTVKLWTHQRNDEKYGDSEFVFNTREFPYLKAGDVVEIHDKDSSNSRLLLPVGQIQPDFTSRDTVSIDQAVAATFSLTKYQNVVVSKVDPAAVALDLVELIFKEQYLSRSDMWRLKKHLLTPPKRVVYTNKQIRFCDIRAQVNEMYSAGIRVSCGVVVESTRVVFRSGSAMMFIFIQMSQEMWEFDYQGDLYYEKCVNGFMPDLFSLWKEKTCSHYVTIVVFSRWFYDTLTIEDFPADIRERINIDYQGRFYEDFYRVIVQNEHYDDWTAKPVISKLKSMLNEYTVSIRGYHSNAKMPPARNSTAQEGNYLEVINMSLNVFAKHYVDRNFERTGQVTVIVTPGQGVFKVDRNLCNLTKQRVNDIGLCLDLVCLGEQPLHAVPLFIFPSRQNPGEPPDFVEDFVIPHWMNFSFYSPVKYPAVQHCFVPRIKIPESVLARIKTGFPILDMPNASRRQGPVVDYDKYDDEIFVEPKQSISRREKTISESAEFSSAEVVKMMSRHSSRESLLMIASQQPSSSFKSFPMTIPERQYVDSPHAASLEEDFIVDDQDEMRLHRSRTIVGSAGNSPTLLSYSHRKILEQQRQKQRKPLMNPFKPAEFAVRITSNRRRFIHVFPVDAAGKAKQAHHYVSGVPVFYVAAEDEQKDFKDGLPFDLHLDFDQPPASPLNSPTGGLEMKLCSITRDGHRYAIGPTTPTSTVGQDGAGKTLVWAWGVTGEEQWNPDLKISMDWKSFTLPATLPNTIDFFPDHRSLRNDYVFSEHSIFLDEAVRDLWDPMKFPFDVFDELVHQRLHQGFQVIVLDKELLHSATAGIAARNNGEKIQTECYLCINRIFHRLTLIDCTIYVMKFLPRHAYNLAPLFYHYQFEMPDSLVYESSSTRFVHENLELYKWSLVDNYIVWKGQTEDFTLDRNMKFWESRFMLVPVPTEHSGVVKKIAERKNSGQNDGVCNSVPPDDEKPVRSDLYGANDASVCTPTRAAAFSDLTLIDGFVKTMETLNRIRRPASAFRIGKQSQRSSTDSWIGSEEGKEVLIKADSTTVLSVMSKEGLFLPKGDTIPEATFVSAEFVHWLLENVSDIADLCDAIAYGQALLDQSKIQHISRQANRAFYYGFFLYFLTPTTSAALHDAKTGVSKVASSWIEIRIETAPDGVFCSDHDCLLKLQQIDMDPSRKSDRHEWGQVRYGQVYSPSTALEIGLQWMVASGCLVGDLVEESWCRKARTNNHHIVPVPADPFALPSDPNSDPLRCSIFIPTVHDNIANFMPAEKYSQLQCAVLKRFGFIPMSCHPRNQYIHLSGGMFIMTVQDNARGFLWSWNSMLGKRYRSPFTGDEKYLDNVLADFRIFCLNEDDRLSNLIESL